MLIKSGSTHTSPSATTRPVTGMYDSNSALLRRSREQCVPKMLQILEVTCQYSVVAKHDRSLVTGAAVLPFKVSHVNPFQMPSPLPYNMYQAADRHTPKGFDLNGVEVTTQGSTPQALWFAYQAILSRVPHITRLSSRRPAFRPLLLASTSTGGAPVATCTPAVQSSPSCLHCARYSPELVQQAVADPAGTREAPHGPQRRRTRP
jgi:hypothetical protein